LPKKTDTARRRPLTTRGPTRRVSADFAVTTVFTSDAPVHRVRAEPCAECPFRMDVPTGVFPPDAFRESAPTAYDAALSTFGCHMSKMSAPATCAGFLKLHSENNLMVRMSLLSGRIDLTAVSDGGYPLYATYREMAVANGVPADDPCLRPVRGNGETWAPEARR
jgi:hypothetical protein